MKTLKLKERTLKTLNNKMNLMGFRQPIDEEIAPSVYELTYTNKWDKNHVVTIQYDGDDNVLSIKLFTVATPLGMELYINKETWKNILSCIATFQILAA